jgi:dynein heavy chain
VSEGVGLTETFLILAKRDAIKRCIERKAFEVLHMFLKEVQITRGEFEQSRQNPPLRQQEPQYAGSALWAHGLAELVKNSYEKIVLLKQMLNPRDFEEGKENYTTLMAVIKDFKHARYNQWIENVNEKARDNGLQLRLEKTLLKRVESDGSVKSGAELVCNFDEDLLTLFAEVMHWEKFHGEFTIPYLAHDICNKKENLRVMRELVMLIVRAYNDIIRDINADEKRLFIDHIRRLDRKIAPGLNKLTWQSKNLIEMYVRDCCSNCSEVHNTVKDFKESKVNIHRICKQINGVILLRVDKNQVYEGGVFESRQKEHRTKMCTQYEQSYVKIMTILRGIYKNFKEGSTEVQREWKSQISQVFFCFLNSV